MLKIEQAYPFQSVPTLTGEWVAVFEGQNMTFAFVPLSQVSSFIMPLFQVLLNKALKTT